MLVSLIIAFNLGLFSTFHCIGMCGGIITAMMFTKGDAEKNYKLKVLNRSLVYNLGRITSYSIAGLLFGFLGASVVTLSQSLNAHIILQTIAALVLIGLALNILGCLPFKNYLESLGIQLWKVIQPLGRSLYPINSNWRALLFGMLWGWLPCGLVYSALLLSLSAGGPYEGMLTMLFFGLGTLPGMVLTGCLTDYINRIKNNSRLKLIAAFSMILIAISLPVSTYYFSVHHDHKGSDSSIHQHH